MTDSKANNDGKKPRQADRWCLVYYLRVFDGMSRNILGHMVEYELAPKIREIIVNLIKVLAMVIISGAESAPRLSATKSPITSDIIVVMCCLY